jgi:hypothetical protein
MVYAACAQCNSKSNYISAAELKPGALQENVFCMFFERLQTIGKGSGGRLTEGCSGNGRLMLKNDETIRPLLLKSIYPVGGATGVFDENASVTQ